MLCDPPEEATRDVLGEMGLISVAPTQVPFPKPLSSPPRVLSLPVLLPKYFLERKSGQLRY